MFFFCRGGTELNDEEKFYEDQIRADEKMIVYGLGDLGEAVNLEGEEMEKGEEDLKRIALNEYLSRKLAYNRTLKGIFSIYFWPYETI